MVCSDPLPPPYFTSWYRSISLTTPKLPLFQSLNLPRSAIAFFFHLYIAHNLLSSHSYRIPLNSSPPSKLHLYEANYDIYHILFMYLSSFCYLRSSFLSNLSFLGYSSSDIIFLLDSRYNIVISFILTFISYTGFLI